MKHTEQITTPEKAFDFHTAYAEFRAGNPSADWNVHLGYYRAARGFSLPTGYDESWARVYHESARTIDDTILMRADTVFLTDDLRSLVTTAEATMPDEVLFDTDVYTPCGFVVMETPLTQDISARISASDLDGLVASARAVGGTVTGTRLYGEEDKGSYIGTDHWHIRAFAWADIEAMQPEALAEIDRRYGAESAIAVFARDAMLNYSGDARGVFVRVYGSTFRSTVDGLQFDIPFLAEKAPLRLVSQYVFFYGEEGLALENAVHGEVTQTMDTDTSVMMNNESLSRAREVRRFLLALFRLMDEYVEIESTKLHRAYGRRATRSGRVGDVKNVTVLSMRRALYDDEGNGASGRKITMAHLVRGHWRKQWYPSQRMHRAKWIRAHRRGGNGTEEIAERPRVIAVDR